jgi:hypothetical protein
LPQQTGLPNTKRRKEQEKLEAKETSGLTVVFGFSA